MKLRTPFLALVIAATGASGLLSVNSAQAEIRTGSNSIDQPFSSPVGTPYGTILSVGVLTWDVSRGAYYSPSYDKNTFFNHSASWSGIGSEGEFRLIPATDIAGSTVQYFTDPLNLNALVDANQTFNEIMSVLANISVLGGETKRFGYSVIMPDSPSLLYGWVELDGSESTPNHLIVRGTWAYDTTGAPITVGTVPEPTTLVLVGLGCLLLLARCRLTHTFIKSLRFFRFAIMGICLSANFSAAHANTEASWVAWNAPSSLPFDDNGRPYAMNTTGVILFNDSTQMTVSFQGPILGETFNNTPAGWWESSPFTFSSAESTWTSSTVSNLPSNSDVLLTSFNLTPRNTLVFSQPVERLVMNIASLGWAFGNIASTWVFDQPFTILSQDLGTAPNKQLFDVQGNTLTGVDSSGTLLFEGPISSLSWDITQPEGTLWNVGTLMTTVPEPSTYALLSLSALGLLLWTYRRKAR